MKTSITFAAGHRLTVGPQPPLSEPPRALLRRLRKQIRDYLDRHDRTEWDDFALDQALESGTESWAPVELWHEIIERDPSADSFLHLGDALIEAGHLEAALEVAGEVHRSDPDDLEAQELLVKILDVLGRNYRDYPWIRQPTVAELGAEVIERCHRRLLEHRPIDSLELFFDLFGAEVCLFDDCSLVDLLARDRRFQVGGDEYFAILDLEAQ